MNRYTYTYLIVLIIICSICSPLSLTKANRNNIGNISETTDTLSINFPFELTGYASQFLNNNICFILDASNYVAESENIKIINAWEWRGLYHVINHSSGNGMVFPDVNETMKNARNFKEKDGLIPIGIIYAKYLTFKPEPFEEGLISLDPDNSFIDPSLSADSVYKMNEVFLSSFIITDELKDKEYQFIISDDFYFTNVEKNIELFEIDFGDGLGSRIVKKNEIINVKYDTPDNIYIKVNPVFDESVTSSFSSTNDIKETVVAKFKTTVAEFTPPECSYEGVITSKITDFNYSSTGHFDDQNGAYGKAEIKIWCCEEGSEGTFDYFDRPLIIADGFDPFPQKRDCDSIYLMAQKWNNTIDILKNECYDIVTVNWLGGGDWIQKNAFALIEVINFINKHKKGVNEIVYIGPSMAGIIGRYALAYMEQNNMPHNVGIYISNDSPHRGANIPLGVQHYIAFFKDMDETGKAEENFRQLTCPASRQLLLHYLSDKPDNMRYDLLDELNTLGNYPVQCKKIAMASGSGIGVKQINDFGQYLNPGDQIFKMECKHWLFGLPGWGYIYAVPDKNMGKTKFFEGVKLINKFPAIYLHRTLYVENTIPLDNCPGGYYPFSQKLAEKNDKKCDMSTWLDHPYWTYTPTISALDLDHSIDDYFYFMPTKNQTPFDEIVYTVVPDMKMNPKGYAFNEKHCYITKNKQNKLMQYLKDFGNGYPTDAFVQNKTLHLPGASSIGYQLPVYFQSHHSITAGNNVDPSQSLGNVTIKANNDIYFHAGKKISLKKGFKVEKGASFKAKLKAPEHTCHIYGNKLKDTRSRTSTNIGVQFYSYNKSIDYGTKNLSLGDNESINASVYPNPGRGEFVLEFSGDINEINKIEIYDLAGNKILESRIKNTITRFNISDYTKGIYIIKIIYHNHQQIEKVIYQ